MGTTYEKDIVAWANEQARLLRSGELIAIDREHIADEIEDVGKSEQRELASRMSILIAHLLKWQFQSHFHNNSWQRTIREQRKAIARRLRKTPSLNVSIADPEWLEDVWGDAVSLAIQETEIANFPDSCPWSIDELLSEGWLPSN